MEMAARKGPSTIHHEAVVLPGSPTAPVAIFFRIPNSRLIFRQDGAQNEFFSEVELTVELFRKGSKIEEILQKTRHVAGSFEETQSSTRDLAGTVRFDLPPGEYSYRLVVNRAGEAGAGAFVVDGEESLLPSTVLFGHSRSEGPAVLRVVPTNLGGNVHFGGRDLAVVPVGRAVEQVAYRLYRTQLGSHDLPKTHRRRHSRRADAESRAPRIEAQELEIGPEDELITSGVVRRADFVPAGALRSIEPECICWSEPSDADAGAAGYALAFIDFNTAQLENGAYVLQLSADGGGRTDLRNVGFRTHWRDMPVSLYDVEVAIRNLSFIESRETVREMLRGSREDRLRSFQEYWRARDPSDGTAFNELMAEFYRRIDHAASEFRTGRVPVPDGLRTDQARIYIVNGPADEVSNTFPASGGVNQEWTYRDGRRFVFWAPTSFDPFKLQETGTGVSGSNL